MSTQVSVYRRPAAKYRGPVGWWLAAALIVVGLGQVGQGLYIHAKALLAQVLLTNAWAATLDQGGEVQKAWPWADTWPVARLVVPGHGIDAIVLEGASGEALAFGPGRMGEYAGLSGAGVAIIAAHKDTHFSFLPDLQTGDELWLETADGQRHDYRVVEATVLDSRTDTIGQTAEIPTLVLLTCYPFDPLVVGGPLRYLVFTERAS